MALKTIVENLDDIPEALHEEYKEVETKGVKRYVLQLTGINEHPDVVNLKSAHETTKTRLRETKEQLETANDRLEGFPEDFDHEAYEDLKARAEGKGGQNDERLAQVRATLEAKHAKELEKKDTRINTLTGQLNKLTVGDGLTNALVAANVDKALLPAARALIKDMGVIKLQEDEGTFTAVVETDLGPVSIDKFVTDWAASDEGKPFIKEMKGGGANGGNDERGSNNPFDTQGGKVKPNLTKQQELIASNPEKARQLAKAAGVAVTW